MEVVSISYEPTVNYPPNLATQFLRVCYLSMFLQTRDMLKHLHFFMLQFQVKCSILCCDNMCTYGLGQKTLV